MSQKFVAKLKDIPYLSPDLRGKVGTILNCRGNEDVGYEYLVALDQRNIWVSDDLLDVKHLEDLSHYLGSGVLTWDKRERISDRYGFVYLIGDEEGDVDFDYDVVKIKNLVDRAARGKLFVKVISARVSHHIGDAARGFVPSTPDVGEVIYLSDDGVLVYNKYPSGNVEVGIRPDDGRESDWLNPEALYRVVDQVVELYFEESV